MSPDTTEHDVTDNTARRPMVRWNGLLALLGVGSGVAALLAAPHEARSAATQTWSPFVLVSGLLLVGLVAEADGLFRAAGSHLARAARNGVSLFVGATLLIIVVTATLNLDTSVVFLTPVLIAATRQLGSPERSLLYGSLLLANASSLFLPGSNLTNLIVLGHHPLSGGGFLALMWPAALAASVVTACCIAVWARHDLVAPTVRVTRTDRPVLGVGLLAVVLVIVLVLVLPSPALPVLSVGVVATLFRVVQRRLTVRGAVDTLGLPVLVGLFGITVGLGTLGRVWSGPATMLSHLGSAGTAVVSAAFSVLFNNLPAASLLAARYPPHPAPLLIGLNLGPNLFVTGSLAWFLWLKVARAAGADPSIRRASRLGLVVVPLSLAAALAALALAGSG
jgi:arsenical pump membrane protein